MPAAFSGRYWLAGRKRTLSWSTVSGTTHLSVEGMGSFRISPRKGRADISTVHRPEASSTAMLEVALGPLLTSLLAVRGVFCLHAGAITGPHGAVCFLGDSGAGKSTLCAYLSGREDVSTSVADDVAPVTLADGGARLLPDYPQLKLPASALLRGPSAPQMVAAMVLLRPRTTGAVVLARMNPAESSLALMRHTVGAQIFDRELLRLHFEFCTRLAAEVECFVLDYPHDRSSLPAVASALAAGVWSVGTPTG